MNDKHSKIHSSLLSIKIKNKLNVLLLNYDDHGKMLPVLREQLAMLGHSCNSPLAIHIGLAWKLFSTNYQEFKKLHIFNPVITLLENHPTCRRAEIFIFT